ncbi:pentapeptide repeat-containing protein [Amycolatopsis nigrescens]|uniref:pentapeptide repeat-containing protein n=1 Tax=Amycolatopsis nigrescens TaxID=381445 RepID=UPI000373AD60|nr:pentapeptide repeat-containing protein [Amycolatopsis nigrescens]
MADPDRRPAWKSPLFATTALSLLLLVAVTGWLLTDKATNRSEALKTGGLAGGAVVALYALWLNDRRRQVEERRQAVEQDRYELESSRAEHDRLRVADERFARAVELLGHEADQVRVGALHALAGLAESRPGYTQTVLDVLCSYLRRPFEHARYQDKDATDTAEVENELTVRLSAQRLINDLLPAAHSEAPSYDLDLTGASLEYLDLNGRKIGTLTMRQARLRSRSNLSECEITGQAWFTDVTTGSGRLAGKFRCRDTTFGQRAWFSGTTFGWRADFENTRFLGEASFKDAVFENEVLFKGARFQDELDLRRTQFKGNADLRFEEPPGTVHLQNTFVAPGRTLQWPGTWQVEISPEGRVRMQ